ncbi:MAG: response regulator [Rhizomicrobium sp.]
MTTAPKILIAEDEALLRLVAVETLRDAGYDVLEAVDGNEGLAVIQTAERIDLLVTDIKMPGLNGYQLAEAGLRLRPDMKVVLMTGYSDEHVPDAIARATIRIFHKPFNFDDLLAFIGGILALRPA